MKRIGLAITLGIALLLTAFAPAQGDLSIVRIHFPVPEGFVPSEMVSQIEEVTMYPVMVVLMGDQTEIAVGEFSTEAEARFEVASLLDHGFLDARIVDGSAAANLGTPWGKFVGIALLIAALCAGGAVILRGRQIAQERASARRSPKHDAAKRSAKPAPAPAAAKPKVKPHAPPVLPVSAERKRIERMPAKRTPVPLFSDEVEHLEPGMLPTGWTPPETGIASLKTVSDDAQGTMLDFVKLEIGAGGYACCDLPRCAGEIIVEMDVLCHHKNKYLLGIYLQEGQNFLKSISTQFVGDSETDADCRVRMQQEEAHIPWGEWVHLLYEIDLGSGRVICHCNGERIGLPCEVTNPLQAIDTLVIRTAPETQGHFTFGHVRIWSASELRSAEKQAVAVG